MKTLSELEAEEARLWEELDALEVPYAAKRNEWAAVKEKCDRERLREEIKAEIAKRKAEGFARSKEAV